MKSPDHQQQAAGPPRDTRGENASTERASGESVSSEDDSSEDDSSEDGSGSSTDGPKEASAEWLATSHVEPGHQETDQVGTDQVETDQVEGQSFGDRVMITIGTAVIGMNGGATGISVAGWLIHMRGWSYDMVGDLSIVLMALLALAGAQTFSRGSS